MLSHYAESVVVITTVMLIVLMLGVTITVMLNVVMLNVVIVSVNTPFMSKLHPKKVLQHRPQIL